MNKIKSQKGQAIILLAFAIVGLVGFGALAIDGGRVLSDRRHAQNAADTAAFAAALAKIQGGNINAAGLNRALSNGYDNNSTLQDVVVNNPPASGPYAGNNEYVQVIITSTINTSFARVIGRPQVTSVVEAVARAQGTTVNPLVTGAALAAFQRNGTSFNGTGNGTLDVIGSGIFSNSTDTDCPNGAMKLYGNITYEVDTGFASPGSTCAGNNANIDSSLIETVEQVPIPEYNIPAPTFTCSGTGSLVGTEYQPGNYNGLSLPPSGNYTFAAGNYCFNGSVSIRGNVTANNVNFRINGDLTTNSNSSFTCNNVIMHTVGGSGISFNGSSTNNCTNITFYMESGGVQWNGNANNTFTAPTSGTYDGLLIYLPNDNSSSVYINGNSGNQFTGSVIAVSSAVSITGNSNTGGLHTQVLANTIDFSGTGTTQIHYNPDEQYNPPAFPTIELTK